MKKVFSDVGYRLRLTVVTAILLTVSACGFQKESKNQVDNLQFSDLTWEEHSELIEERHGQRWQEVINVNFDGVYEFATPEYRRLYSKAHLHNQYAAQIRRKKAQVIAIEQDPSNEQTALVKTALTFSTVLPNGELYEDEIALDERWRFSQGQWWFVEPK